MITLRPHHILCLQGFQGKGYSTQFISSLLELHKKISDNHHQKITIKIHQDSICSHCPHNNLTECNKDSKANQRMIKRDHATLKKLQFKEGQYSWKQLIEMSQNKISGVKDLQSICFGCDWKKVCLFYLKIKATENQSQSVNV